jgi:hypothetical protein
VLDRSPNETLPIRKRLQGNPPRDLSHQVSGDAQVAQEVDRNESSVDRFGLRTHVLIGACTQ